MFSKPHQLSNNVLLIIMFITKNSFIHAKCSKFMCNCNFSNCQLINQILIIKILTRIDHFYDIYCVDVLIEPGYWFFSDQECYFEQKLFYTMVKLWLRLLLISSFIVLRKISIMKSAILVILFLFLSHVTYKNSLTKKTFLRYKCM